MQVALEPSSGHHSSPLLSWFRLIPQELCPLATSYSPHHQLTLKSLIAVVRAPISCLEEPDPQREMQPAHNEQY